VPSIEYGGEAERTIDGKRGPFDGLFLAKFDPTASLPTEYHRTFRTKYSSGAFSIVASQR